MPAQRSKFRPTVEVLENRLCLTGLGVIEGAHVIGNSPVEEAADPIAIEATTEQQAGDDLLIVNNGDGPDVIDGQEIDDLLIVNNGDGSDFVEAGPGGGPHVKVFDAATDPEGDIDEFFRDLGRDTADRTYGSEIEIMSWGWGETNSAADTVPTDQLSLNFEKIEFDY